LPSTLRNQRAARDLVGTSRVASKLDLLDLLYLTEVRREAW
jgi:hypothetical protein